MFSSKNHKEIRTIQKFLLLLIVNQFEKPRLERHDSFIINFCKRIQVVALGFNDLLVDIRIQPPDFHHVYIYRVKCINRNGSIGVGIHPGMFGNSIVYRQNLDQAQACFAAQSTRSFKSENSPTPNPLLRRKSKYRNGNPGAFPGILRKIEFFVTDFDYIGEYTRRATQLIRS